MIVVDMPADVKSHWPSDGTMGHADGAGRKASGQFLWALGSKSCNNIINEIYGNNGFALTNLREYLIALGLDIEEDTSLRVGYHRQVNRNEKRKLYKLPLDNKAYFKQVKLRETVKDEEKKAFNGLENTKLISAEFQKMIAQGGGFLEIPFKLEYSTFRKARINSNTFAKLNKEHGYSSFAETGHSYTDPSGVKHPTYAMPIMSKAVREGFSAVDGSKKPHEYTSAYTKIYLDSIKYIAIERAVCKLKKNKKMSEEQQQAVAKLEEKMRKLEKDAQKQYDDVVSSIIEDKIDTKENLIGKGCMTARIPNAATAVWSADPNLNINEVAMSLEHAKSLMLCDKDGNLKKDASVLLWRDPCLHDANVRYMKVVINNNLLGVAVNPLVDKPFAGDFDGDCVALAALHSYEAKMEAKKKLSMETNLLNFSDYDNDKDEYRLFFASDMDVASNWYANPALKEQYEKLQTEINVLEKKVMAYEKGNKKALDDVTFSTKKATFTGMDAVTRLRQKYANNISRVLKESLAGIGNDMLSFGDKESLLKSYDKIARVTKAKGNWKKMDSLAENIGVSYERVDDDTHEIKYDTVKDITDKEGNACTKARAEGYEREWNNETQMIAAYKADDTSTGGMHAKLLVAAFRDIDLKACLELAEPITQGILDSKHFKDDAIARDIIANFWGKDVLKGYKLTGDWSNSKGLSPDDFKNELRNTAHERIKARVKDPNVKGRGVKYIIKTDKDGDPITDRYGNKIYEETYVKCTKKEWIAQMAGMYCALDVPINEEYIKRLADIMTRTEDVPVKSVNGGFVLAKSKDARGNDTVEVVEDGAGTVCGYYDMANEEGAFSDKVNYYENKLRSYAEGALMNEDSYRFADSQNFAVNAAKLNAYDRSKLKIFDVMDAAQKALDYDNALAGLSESEILTDEEKKAAFGRKLEIREAISNSSAYAPDILIDGLKGDLYREQVKSETDILPEKSRNVKVTKENKVVCIDVNVKPLSRSDCLLTNEYEEGVSYMGETEEEYEERMSHEREAMEEISEYEMAAGAELPLSEGNAFDIEDEDDDPDGPKGPGGSGK